MGANELRKLTKRRFCIFCFSPVNKCLMSIGSFPPDNEMVQEDKCLHLVCVRADPV